MAEPLARHSSVAPVSVPVPVPETFTPPGHVAENVPDPEVGVTLVIVQVMSRQASAERGAAVLDEVQVPPSALDPPELATVDGAVAWLVADPAPPHPDATTAAIATSTNAAARVFVIVVSPGASLAGRGHYVAIAVTSQPFAATGRGRPGELPGRGRVQSVEGPPVLKTVKAARFLVTGPLILAMLLVINLMTSPGHLWVKWAALGIGIAWVISLLRVARAIVVGGGLAALLAYLLKKQQGATSTTPPPIPRG